MRKKSRFILKITIIGNTVSLFLIGNGKKIIAESRWEDNRDLSERLLEKADFLLKNKKLSSDNISKVDFYCDSPYFRKLAGNKNFCFPYGKVGGEQNFLFPAKDKCGFTAWQMGEITAKVLNFINIELTRLKVSDTRLKDVRHLQMGKS